MLSPPSLLVTVLDPLASLTLSLVTALLELDELGFELELELIFSGSLDDEDDLEDEGAFSGDEDAFAFSDSLALMTDASELDLEPEDDDELDVEACDGGTAAGLFNSWLNIWSENMSNNPNANTRFTVPVRFDMRKIGVGTHSN